VITAASCLPSAGSTTIGFFWDGQPDDAFTPRANVLNVYEPAGVQGPNWRDPQSNVFDVAVLELDRNVPWQVPAWLTEATLGEEGDTFLQVGLGPHNNHAASFGQMAEHWSAVRGDGFGNGGSSVNQNWWLVNDAVSVDDVRGGDTGGPLYAWGPSWGGQDEGSLAGGGLPPGQAMALVGVNSGNAITNTWDWGPRAGYTAMTLSVIDFVMRALGIGPPNYTDNVPVGTSIGSISTIYPQDCEDLCVKNYGCVAYSWVPVVVTHPGTCTIFSGITGWTTVYPQRVIAAWGQKLSTGPCNPDSSGICRL
jgi:hypothetical protein